MLWNYVLNTNYQGSKENTLLLIIYLYIENEKIQNTQGKNF